MRKSINPCSRVKYYVGAIKVSNDEVNHWNSLMVLFYNSRLIVALVLAT